MPTLDFKGKSFVYTHHLGVPFRELIVVPEKSCPISGEKPTMDDNLILHGDNLESLKALIPRYAGKVDCIYIDPPYNTGNEGWCYNDKVNSPLMREWIKASGNPVEREDLQRHDKWLSMMWPRLQLLKELLSEEGVIFVSIDDNEVHRLRDIMDEVFGEENFIACAAWQKSYTPNQTARHISDNHDYILFYGKDSESVKIGKIQRTADQKATFSNPDKDTRGDWKPENLSAGKYYEAGQFTITGPHRDIFQPPPGRYWRCSEERYKEWLADGRITFGRGGKGRPMLKKFIEEMDDGLTASTWWTSAEAGTNKEASLELKQIFGGDSGFATPKPVKLLERILNLATDENSLILDSFAGSGTTAHAVLSLNAKDGGNRRFILCEMEKYADSITAERVRRVITGYEFEGTVETELCPSEKVTWTTFVKDSKRQTILDRIQGIENLHEAEYDKIEKKITDGVLTVVGQKQVAEKVPGLGGSFTFVELGESMDLERLLSETPGKLPSFASLARYLFYTITGQTLPEENLNIGEDGKKAKAVFEEDGPVLIGETANLRVYLNYKEYEKWLRSPPAALTRQQAEQIAKKRDVEAPEKEVIVISASKYISSKALAELKIQHLQLPYALHRIQAS
jgi:adenine-specific DNA-methyltransferase